MDIQEIARLLGQRGGQARAKNLTASRRKEIASNASRKRWGNLTAKHSTQTANDPSDNEVYMPCKICGKSPIAHWKNKLGHSHN